MHTAEHILNQAMVRMFGCARSKNSHIERKKSKCDYFLSAEPTAEQIAEIEANVNEQIERNLDVSVSFVDLKDAPEDIDLSKLPENASQTIRLVSIGDYDLCACIGDHVKNTGEIGRFRITSSDYSDGKIRIRFKLEDKKVQ
ncbi:MAG: hypothetical protein LBS07_03670 [Prevotellaceae bacterium]|jgi:alanyl-tRNA synthetase|nr:hypothetical protein [Prevotellaceae bacterium]